MGLTRYPVTTRTLRCFHRLFGKIKTTAVILDIICGNPKILGSKTRESLEQEIQGTATLKIKNTLILTYHLKSLITESVAIIKIYKMQT